MGAGQIGGIATLLDIDFNNAAGFLGVKSDLIEAQFLVYYLSHAMMFCTGAIIEAHVVLTPASCVLGERYKFRVFGGTHKFLENSGTSRVVQNLCVHKGFNHTMRWKNCSTDNLALLVLNHQFSFHERESDSEFLINRVRYGISAPREDSRLIDQSCRFYGWGSRRNGEAPSCTRLVRQSMLDVYWMLACPLATMIWPKVYMRELAPTTAYLCSPFVPHTTGYLIPLLIDLRRMDVTILPKEGCLQMWNNDDKYLCIKRPACKSEKFGALCPDDAGSVLVCSGFAQGMMTSRLIDRPCGVGFLDLSKYNKFLTCGVDDSRDVIDHDNYMAFEFTAARNPTTLHVPIQKVKVNETDAAP